MLASGVNGKIFDQQGSTFVGNSGANTSVDPGQGAAQIFSRWESPCHEFVFSTQGKSQGIERISEAKAEQGESCAPCGAPMAAKLNTGTPGGCRGVVWIGQLSLTQIAKRSCWLQSYRGPHMGN